MNKKCLKKILKEHLASNQEVMGRSLIHRHHRKGMIIIENLGPENISRFYKCENCEHTEIPYMARLFGYNEENFYVNF